MKLIVDNFKDGQPTAISHNYIPRDLDIESPDQKYSDLIHLEGTAEKVTDALLLSGTIKIELLRICGRCLKETKDTQIKKFDWTFEIKDKNEIEITSDVRELIVLDRPMVYLCSDTCKGLCPQCGVNLNESECLCPKTAKTHSFQTLKTLISKKEKKHGTS